MPASEIALIVKMHPRSVKRVQARFAEEGIAVLFDAGHGGRYHQYLTLQQEEDFLQPFLKSAEAGGLLTVMPIRNAYEKLVGHEVPKSTVYRMLARHGWRKITPRPRHPKTSVTVQETFKKTLHS